MITFRLIRSARRSLSLSVQADGTLLVRAPYLMSRSHIDSFVASKQSWIDKTLEKWKKANTNSHHEYLKIGSSIKLEGQDCHLATAPVRKPVVEGFQVMLPASFEEESRRLSPLQLDEKLRQTLVGFYRTHARKVLPPLVEEIAARHGLRHSGVSITSARTRWGSCNSRNHLNFSWRLMMAAPECIRYVVCHELAHTVHHNHSRQFWQLVGDICPDHGEARRRLKQLGRELLNTGW